MTNGFGDRYAAITSGIHNLVPQAGLEPATQEFSVLCSTIGAIVAKLALEVTVEGDVTYHWLGCARPRLTQG